MGRGRQTKLTPELREKFCQVIAAGNYYEPACGYVGIDYSTFWRWMEKGEAQAAANTTGQYRDFREAVLKAEAQAEVRAISLWQAAMPDSWQAARDFVARRYSNRWGDKLDVTSKGGQVGAWAMFVKSAETEENDNE